MVKVIKEYFDEPKQIECALCRCTLEYTSEDLNLSSYYEYNCLGGEKFEIIEIYINCPICKQKNNLYNRNQDDSFLMYLYEKLKEEKN